MAKKVAVLAVNPVNGFGLFQYNKEAVIAAFNIAATAVSLDFEWQGEKYAVELAPHDSRVIVKE